MKKQQTIIEDKIRTDLVRLLQVEGIEVSYSIAKAIDGYVDHEITQILAEARAEENKRLFEEVMNLLQVNDNFEYRIKPPLDRLLRVFDEGEIVMDKIEKDELSSLKK